MGAHADAASHYHNNGLSIGERDLNYYIGMCQVIHVDVEEGQRIKPTDMENKSILAQRVLLRSNTFPRIYEWTNDFAALSPELIDELHGKGVILIGIDTPSVDLMESKDLPAHKRLLANDMAVLEGLVLDGTRRHI